MSKKIIHIVLGKANPNRMNGVNRVVHFLSNALSEIGNDIEVWGLSGDQELDQTIDRAYKLKVFINGAKKLTSKDLIKELKETKNAVFHLHGGFIPVFGKIARLIKNNGNEFVFTPHGCYTTGAMAKNKWRKKMFFALHDKPLLLNAKIVQGLGYQESRDMRALVPESNIMDIANGQEDIFLDENDQIEKKEYLTFGYCGRLDRNHKGLDLLVEGFVKFKKVHNSDTKLWIIGGGDYESTMKQDIASAGLTEDVIFFGPKFGNEKFQLIASMDVFFHTSRHEGLPTAVLEACYLGVACAVTPQTSFDVFLEQNKAGWKINELSGDSVLNTMAEILEDHKKDLIKEKSQNASAMIKYSFSWIQIAREVEKMYA